MKQPTSPSNPAVSRPWLAVALAALAAVCLFGSQLIGLENHTYDLFQRYQYKAPNTEIVLLSAPADTEIWTAGGFADLSARLNELGAKTIVAAQPLYLPDAPTKGQIQALAELEQQAARSSSTSEELQRLSAQLAGFRRSFDDEQKLVNQLAASDNIVLAVDARPGTEKQPLSEACSRFAIPSFTASSIRASAEVQLRMPPDAICTRLRALGASNFAMEDDGVVRRTRLLLATPSDKIFPSLALAALAVTDNAKTPVILNTDGQLSHGDQLFAVNSDHTVLLRYYSTGTGNSAFDTIPVADVLNGSADASRVNGRIVLVGATGADATVFETPVDNNMSELMVAATTIANLFDNDYLLRADWLVWVEAALLVVILLLVLLIIPAMPTISTLLVGFVLAMLILSIQAWFLLSEQIWLKLATVSLFTATAVWGTHLLQHLKPGTAKAPQRRALRAVATGQYDPLDLEFSVLRQQPLTDDNKERMYQIAFQHGRAEEFAKAERVLRYIASHDPEFRDVRRLLQKLSGRRQPARPAAAGAHQSTLPPTPRQEPEPVSTSLHSDQKSDAGTERRSLGRYRIERKLGEGAMATVYLGTDPAIGRKVAIKTVSLAEEFDEEQLQDARLQFRREAESAGRLNHPNIISIYDAGEDGDVSYLAMEYFDGVSLLKHAQPDDLLPASWVVELMALAADALDYAHRQNVVHRDIKPANLMYHAASDELKITDFGIARLTDSSRTKTGIILGTPSYMSPEQLTASGVTGQSDLYSLGVTMYQLLTGAAPFRADSIPKLMDKIMRENHRSVTELRSDIPPCIDKILETALAKDPANRFASGRAMAMALRECAGQFKVRQ